MLETDEWNQKFEKKKKTSDPTSYEKNKKKSSNQIL